MSVASGVGTSIVLYLQKRVVDVELDRTVAFYWRWRVLFVKALPDESPQPVPDDPALGGIHRGVSLNLRIRKPDPDDAARIQRRIAF